MKRFLTAAFLLCAAAASAAEPKEWRDLSDKDLSPDGKAALATPGEWKHAESEHFVYHFVDEKEADTVLAHAETYYGWIKQIFGVADDAWKRKAHVFVFHDEAGWKAFLGRVRQTEHQPGAFTDGWEVFLHREKFWLTPQKVLAHELSHVIAFRFLDGPIPLFVNEGFAEYVGWKAAAQKADGNEYRVRAMQWIPEEAYVPLAELSAARRYPEDVKTFYAESELFVRWLLTKRDPALFYAFLRDLSRGTDVDRALRARYGEGLREMEGPFRAYATTGK